MSFGKGGGQKVKPTAPPPTEQDPAVEAAKADIRDKRRRSYSRRDTRITQAQTSANLKDTLG